MSQWALQVQTATDLDLLKNNSTKTQRQNKKKPTSHEQKREQTFKDNKNFPHLTQLWLRFSLVQTKAYFIMVRERLLVTSVNMVKVITIREQSWSW